MLLVAIADAALLTFAQNQVSRPFGPGIYQSLPLLGCQQNSVHCVEACPHGLGAQCSFESSTDNQHGRTVRERPDRQHKAIVLTWSSTNLPRQPLAHEIERRPRLVQGGSPAYAVEQH